MKSFFTILVVFITITGLKAQDIIVKNDKTELKAKIEELTETTIKYKKFEMLDGPSYNINKRDVFMIIYKNGTKEYIESNNNLSQSKSVEENNTTNKSANIDIETGEVINHEKFIVNGKIVTFEGKQVKRKSQMKILNEKGSTQVRDLASSYRVLNIGSDVANVFAAIGIVSSLKSAEVTRPGLFIGSAVVFGGSLLMAVTGVNKLKKAVNLFNKEGYSTKVSFNPILNKDKMGNHIGLNIRF